MTRVLHLSTYGAKSGAGVAALRLLEAERSYGLDAELLLMAPSSESLPAVHTLGNDRRLYRAWQCKLWSERALVALLNGFNREQTFKTSLGRLGISIHALRPYLANIDILHLHWTQHAFLSLRTIEELCKLGLPVVITLHDYWWVQGIEQMATKPGELSAPLLRLDRRVQQRKAELMAHYPIYLVTVSSSLGNAVTRSSIVPRLGVSTIGNVLSAHYYQQAQMQETRATSERELYRIIFVATRLDDPIKGWNYLVDAMRQLAQLAGVQTAQMQLTLVGTLANHELLNQIPLPVQHLGSISDVAWLSSLYAESSVLISTSESESFGQTLLESLACGTPVIARDSGGPADIVIDGVNGALVAHDAPQAMAAALWKHFTGATDYQPEACRASALRFAPTDIAQQYAQLYAQLIDDIQRAKP
ncbi:glycosyltransferase [uncultured Porphyromonas sp.]|uniref:glycosyltransferase n=1 Tax=uncultured Porphyromonas sp. TaxID=159274 RepID=UPI00261B7A36|nr:glycosyltransferase [uncultured Porphyromonas sp.]